MLKYRKEFTMRVFRMCNPKEIKAIENDKPIKLTFGGGLHNYIQYFSNYNNNYACFNSFWNKIRRRLTSKVEMKQILKDFFGEIPKEIPLFEEDLTKRDVIYKKFSQDKSELSHIEFISEPYIKAGKDITFLSTIKLAACFFDPTLHNEIRYVGENSGRVIAFDLPNNLVKKFSGTGIYGRKIRDGNSLSLISSEEECAIPMFKLRSDYVLCDYELGGKTHQNFIKDFNNGK